MTADDLIPSDMDNKPIKVQGYISSSNKKADNNIKSSSSEEPVTAPTPTPPQCDVSEIEKGKITSYISPPSGLDVTNDLLRQVVIELAHHRELFAKIERFLSYESPTGTYYEFRGTTSFATPNQPNTPDTITNGTIPGYDEAEVNNRLQGRNAPKLYLVNDGPNNLFVITSSDGKTFSPEFLMINGETRIISSVYSFRFRSPVAGNNVRASEREVIPPYVTQVTNTFAAGTSNRPNFTAQRIAVGGPFADNTITNILGSTITIPDGFAIALIANVNNAGQIFISRTDATIAAQRTTLAAGDVRSLFITNTDIIHVAGSVAGQFLDLIVEQT